MSGVGIALIVVGAILIARGYRGARRNWSEYEALASSEANIARYERWRGGTRPEQSAAATPRMKDLRRRAALQGLLALAGFVLVFQGFALG